MITKQSMYLPIKCNITYVTFKLRYNTLSSATLFINRSSFILLHLITKISQTSSINKKKLLLHHNLYMNANSNYKKILYYRNISSYLHISAGVDINVCGKRVERERACERERVMRNLKYILLGEWADGNVGPRDKVIGNIGQRTLAVWMYKKGGETFLERLMLDFPHLEDLLLDTNVGPLLLNV